MQLDGHLVVRWRAPDRFDVSFVPAGPTAAGPPPVRSLRGAGDLSALLRALGFTPLRIAQILDSPCVLHSLPARVDAALAERLGLLPRRGLARVLRGLAALVAAARERLGLQAARAARRR